MLPNIYAIDLQIRRFCSDPRKKRSTHRVQYHSGPTSTVKNKTFIRLSVCQCKTVRLC